MRPTALLPIALALVFASGCVPTASMVKELSKSKRSWCLYWAGGMGIGEVRVSGSGIEADANETASSLCETKSHGVNQSASGPALGAPAVITPGGDIILRAPPRVLQQEAPTYREIQPPAAPQRAPAIRPQSAPRSQFWDDVLRTNAVYMTQ